MMIITGQNATFNLLDPVQIISMISYYKTNSCFIFCSAAPPVADLTPRGEVNCFLAC